MKLTIIQSCMLAICSSLLHGCQSSAPVDLSSLVRRPPLPYSILVTGGAFLSGGDPNDRSVFRNTFTTAERSDGEALSLEQVSRVLRDARVFVRSDTDPSDATFRAQLAGMSGPLDLSQDSMREFLSRARRDGADYLLVLEGLRDGRVIDLGINDRWPWTFALWLAFGIGAVIPDHGFTTAASLRVSLREVQTGRVVPGTRVPFSGGSLDLSLVSRGSSWWWLKMIVVPPSWIGSDQGKVVKQMRRSASQRLLFSLARYLKDASFLEDLHDFEIARVELRHVDSGLEFVISARQSLSYLRLRLNQEDLVGEVQDRFEADLLASETREDGGYVYRGVLPMTQAAGQLQVMMQTVGGEVASSTREIGSL